MSDREKILKAAKCCLTGDPMHCPDECPYLIDGFSCGLDPFLTDIIAYLEEQEHELEETRPELVEIEKHYICGHCELPINNSFYQYCPYCGRKVKWDD